MPRRPPLTPSVVVVLAAVISAGCTPAPSGRLDTAPQDGPTVQPSPPASVTTLPTFDAATAVGTYAEGFPRELLQAPPEEIVASSAEPVDGGLIRLSLSLASSRTTPDVLARLGAPLAATGFAETTTSVVSGLTAQIAWTRRTDRPDGPLVETLLVGVLDDGARRLVSVSGTVQVQQG